MDSILTLFADDARLINPMTGDDGIQAKAALRTFNQQLVVSSLVDYRAFATGMVIEGNTLVAPLRLEGSTPDGRPIVMNNLNFRTFEDGKFKILLIYMDTHSYYWVFDQALAG